MPVFSKLGLKPGAIANKGRHIVIDGVADGFEAFCLARLVEEIGERGPIMYIVRDGQRIADLEQVLGFVSPDLPVLHLPAWDCLPYDRVSPGADAAARRLAALSALCALKKAPHPAVILTTANAVLQKIAAAGRTWRTGDLSAPRQPARHERSCRTAGAQRL